MLYLIKYIRKDFYKKEPIENMILRNLFNFSTKKSGFFWNQVNQQIRIAKYAVRGEIPTLAQHIQNEIVAGSKQHKFNQVTFTHIGNPHMFNQRPITFNREVLSCVINPNLIDSPFINPDASKRAKKYLQQIVSAGSYTHSLGILSVRKTVAKYISKVDNVVQPSPQDIFLTVGASEGIHEVLKSLITNQNDAVMIPVPRYPLYTASICVNKGYACQYYLSQQKGWQIDVQQLQKSYQNAIKLGKTVKSIVMINPGNPTGSLLTKDVIKQIIKFSVQKKLVLIADQVYRDNVYKEQAVFQSANKLLHTMDERYIRQCELISLHSISKGLLGQCGLRGGYFYLYNINPEVKAQLVKSKSINLCSNTIGQLMIDLMCNPPLQDVEESTKSLYLKQCQQLFNSLKRRAQIVTKTLQSMKNITCNQVQGALYAYAQVKMSNKAIKAAQAIGKTPDQFYCLQVLKNTGITLLPGTDQGQKPGTHHFRITILVLPQEKAQLKLEEFKRFNQQFHNRYEE